MSSSPTPGTPPRARHQDVDPKELAFDILPPNPHGNEDRVMAAVARVMDDLVRIPGTRWRVGLDPLMGLVPGVGDGVSNIISALALFHASRGGLPHLILMRMAVNILINGLLGAVPFVGDALSFWFKSNRRNYRLLVANLGKRRSSPADFLILSLMLTLLVACLIGIAVGIVAVWAFLARTVGSHLFGPRTS